MTDKPAPWETKELYRDPVEFCIYKGVRGKYGVLRFSMKKPYLDENRNLKGKYAGCVFLDAAPAAGPNTYDWEKQKIQVALSVNDMAKIILYLRNPKHSMFIDRDRQFQPLRDEEGNLKYKDLSIYHEYTNPHSNVKKTTTYTISKPDYMVNYMVRAQESTPDGKVIKEAQIPISPDECISIGTLLQTAINITLAWDPSRAPNQETLNRLDSIDSKISEMAAMLRQSLQR